MRHLHVYAGPFPSHQGTQVAIAGLLQGQVAIGDAVVLRCWAGGVGAAPAGVEVRRLPGGRSLRSGPSLARGPLGAALAIALRRDLRERWDAVHLHHVEAALLGAALRGVFRVHHQHTCLAEELPAYPGLGAGAGRIGAALDAACARGGDLTVALSPRGAALARAAGARDVLVLPPSVEALPALEERDARRALGLEDGRWVAYTGNLDGYQDLDRLVAAVALAGARLVVATADDPGGLRAAAARAGLAPERLRVVVGRDPALGWRALAASRALVVPRARCAGYPMKALNALALGRPVVAGPGALAPGPGIARAADDDVGALAAAIRTLLDDPATADRLGAEGRAWALAQGHPARAAALGAVLRARVIGPSRAGSNEDRPSHEIAPESSPRSNSC